MFKRLRGAALPLALAVCTTAFTSYAQAQSMKIDGTISDIFGHRVVVQAADGKKLVNLGPKIDGVAMLKTGDKVIIEGDMKKSGEVRAMSIKLADGRDVVLEKDKQTWKEWLLGDDDDAKPFTEADARKIATDQGYTLSGELTAEKRHFATAAMKDGKSYDVDIHRDGSIKEHAKMSATEASSAISKGGYTVVGSPMPEKKHYVALAKKGENFYEVHAHRDGELKEVRRVDKSDPKWGAQIN